MDFNFFYCAFQASFQTSLGFCDLHFGKILLSLWEIDVGEGRLAAGASQT